MKNNFRVISVCSLMAAFATSSWAASNCPTDKDGWAIKGAGVCTFTISSVKDTTINIPADLETFDLNYDGSNDGNIGKINIHCDNHLNTVSITPNVVNLIAGSSLSIRNRIDALGLGLESFYVSTVEGYQPTKDMYTCVGKLCQSSDVEVTGLNALSVVFDAKKDNENGKKNKFAISVRQKQYDFGPMQVLNIDGIKEVVEGNGLAQMVLKANLGIDITTIPDGIKSALLIRGEDENTLMSVPADIPVDYVYLDREFTANDNGDARSTIAFPFDISSDAIDGASEILQFTRIGKDAENKDAVFMKKVYCAQSGEKCPAKNGTLKAYKPYIVQLKSGVTSLQFNGPVTLKATPTESGYADFADPNSFWVFRGVFEKIAWNDEAPDNVYGYAAEGDYKGQFVKAGKGAYILPFRGFLIYLSPLKIAPANASYALRPNVLPDEMKIVIEGDNNETTVIGKFNTRTGEMNFINNMKHTYDLKGRRVNGTNNARGAYYGKKVLMK